MGPKQKIYLNIFLSIVITGAMFGFVLPKMGDGLLALQDSHREQIEKLRQLNEQAKSLSKMNEDLTALEKMEVKPSRFFTSDATLVNEIKTIEEVAAKTGTTMTLNISGTADKAETIKSQSGLSQVPYAVTLTGTYPAVVNFIKYMENRYFISPINGINISAGEAGSAVTASILSNFYIYKPEGVVEEPTDRPARRVAPVEE